MTKKAKIPLDVLPLLLELYAAASKEYPEDYKDVGMKPCRCRMCRIVRRLKRVMPPSRRDK